MSGGGGSAPPPPPNTSALSLSSTSLSFTTSDLDYPTAAQTVTVTNSGTASVFMNSEALSGTNSFNFGGIGGGVGGCDGLTLTAEQSCSVKVVFTAYAPGTYTATLKFTDAATDSPQSVALNGTASYSATPTASAREAFVMDSGGTIKGFSISSAGAWTATAQGAVDTGDNSGAMVIDPQGKFLFAAGFVNDSILSYTVDPTTYALTRVSQLSGSNGNNRPENMLIDSTGQWLYVSNTGLSSVSTYTVNRTTGALTYLDDVTIPGTVSLPSSSPDALITDPTDHYLYVSSNSGMYEYAIDQGTGALTPLSPAFVQGGGYFNMHWDPAGQHLFAAAGRSPYVGIYTLNATTGQLTVDGTQKIAYDSDTDLAITMDGTHAYFSDRDGGYLTLYNLSSGTALTVLSQSPLSQIGEPYQLAVDPGGQLIYILSETGGVIPYLINSDGTLSNEQSLDVTMTDSPVILRIYPY